MQGNDERDTPEKECLPPVANAEDRAERTAAAAAEEGHNSKKPAAAVTEEEEMKEQPDIADDIEKGNVTTTAAGLTKTKNSPTFGAAAEEGKPMVAVTEEEEKIEQPDIADDIEKGNVTTTATGLTKTKNPPTFGVSGASFTHRSQPADGGATNNQAQTLPPTQNDDNRPTSHPGVLFVPGPDFRGGIHTGYHSAHESDDDNNDELNVADTLLVEGTLVPEEPDIPTYEATLVPEEDLESPEANSKWYKTPLIICGGFTIVGVALAIGLPLGLQNTAKNDAAVLAVQSPSFSPSVSARPSLRQSSNPSLNPTTTPFFKQKGQPKNGNAEMDLFGGTFSLSTDGSTLVVSAPQLGPMPNRSGYVLVMKWNETLSDYEQLGEPMFGDNFGDGFGYTLALSGDASKLVVGTPYHDMNGEQSGYVKIYLWNEAALNYTHTGDIFYGTQTGDLFGDTLQMSSNGRALAIGASSSDTNSTDAGEVRIYRWNDTDSSFKLNEVLYGAQGDRFGYSLCISPDDGVIAAGAIGSRNVDGTIGYVKTYAWDADDLHYKQQGLPMYDDDPSVQFGWSCSLSSGGKYLATGALHVTGGGSFDDSTVRTAGQVKVYEWNGTKYEQVGDTLLGERNTDKFGASVSISRDGKILAVGAPQNDSNGAQSGQVKLFKLNESGSNYILYGEPLSGEASSNYFGGPVGIVGDAKSFAVGAVGNGEQGDFSGQLQLFYIPS